MNEWLLTVVSKLLELQKLDARRRRFLVEVTGHSHTQATDSSPCDHMQIDKIVIRSLLHTMCRKSVPRSDFILSQFNSVPPPLRPFSFS